MVLVLAIIGSKTPAAPRPEAAQRPEVPPPPPASSSGGWWGFGVVMGICLAALLGLFWFTGTLLLEPDTQLPAPPQPMPMGLRLVGTALILGPPTYGLGVLLYPRKAATEQVTVAKDEILAPWAAVLLLFIIAGRWIDDAISLELAMIAFIFPWVGAARTLLRTSIKNPAEPSTA